MTAVGAVIAVLLSMVFLWLGGGATSTLAADGATPTATWTGGAAERAVTGPLTTAGLPGTAGPVEYAFGLDYAGATPDAAGVAIPGSGGADGAGGPLEVLSGDTLSGSAAAWDSSLQPQDPPSHNTTGSTGSGDPATARAPKAAVVTVTGADPKSDLGGTLSVSQRPALTTEKGTVVAQSRWQIVDATPEKVNQHATKPGELTAALDGAGTPSASLLVFVADPELTASLEACTAGTGCDPSAAAGADGWSDAARVLADDSNVCWRVIVKNSGNVPMTDVHVATATAGTQTLTRAVGVSIGDIAVGQSAVATFSTPLELGGASTLSADVTVSGTFPGTGPDGTALAARFTDASGTQGRVASNDASATVAQAPADGSGDGGTDPSRPSEPSSASSSSADPAPALAPGMKALSLPGIQPLAASLPSLVWAVTNSWTNPASGSIGNGATATGAAYVSLNEAAGRHGTNADTVVTLSTTHGVFTELPSACSPTASSGVNTATLVCDLGTVDYGTAYRIEYTVLAVGANGDAMAVTTTPTSPASTVTATTVKLTITAGSGIDVVFNSGAGPIPMGPSPYYLPNNGNGYLPFGVRIPVGNSWPSGPITFKVTIANGTVTNAASAVNVTGCVNNVTTGATVNTLPSPAGANSSLYPTGCTVTAQGSGVFLVRLPGPDSTGGYKIPPTVFPTKAVGGATLDPTYNFIAVGGLTIGNSTALQSTTLATSNAGTFTATAGSVTVNNAAVTETDATTTSNRQTVTVSVTGTWALGMNVSSLADGSTFAAGGWLSGQGRASAGQHLAATLTDNMFGNWKPAAVTGVTGGTVRFCSTVKKSVAYDGYIGIQTALINAGVTYSVYTSATSSAPAGASGNVSGTGACAVAQTNTATWTQRTLTAAAASAHAADANIYRLSGYPATGGSMMIVLNVSNSTLSNLPSLRPYFGLMVPAGSAVGSYGYFLGTVTNGSGAWTNNSWGTPATSDAQAGLTPATDYGGTFGGGADLLQVVGWTPSVTKSASVASADPGDVVTFKVVATPLNVVGGSGVVTVPVVDTLPVGETYVPGSATAQIGTGSATAANPTVAGQVLTWNVGSVPYNTSLTISYRATVLPGASEALTNNVSVTAPGVPNPATASATVQVTTTSATVLLKQAGNASLPIGFDSDTWELKLTNEDNVAQTSTDLIDVLPYNGDGRGTAYHGTYQVTTVSLNAGETLYCAKVSPSGIVGDPNHASNANPGTGSSIWTTCAATNVPAGTTAIRIVGGSLGATATKANTLTWTTSGEQVGDAYYNMATARASGTMLAMLSGDLVTVVVDGSTLQVDKTFAAQQVTGWAAGNVLTWTVTVKNSGNSTAYKVRVDDIPGAGLGTATWVASGTGAPSRGTITTASGTGDTQPAVWDVGTLAAGATATAQVRATIAAGTAPGAVHRNFVTVSNPSNPYNDAGISAARVQQNNGVAADTDQADYDEARAASTSLVVQKMILSATGARVPTSGASWAVYPRTGTSLSAGTSPAAGVTIAALTLASGGAAWLVTGLVPGDYWLTETAAPSGYELLAQPLAFTVAADLTITFASSTVISVNTVNDSALGDVFTRVQVADVARLALPLAGGRGRNWWWTGAGMVGVATALGLACVSWTGRRRLVG